MVLYIDRGFPGGGKRRKMRGGSCSGSGCGGYIFEGGKRRKMEGLGLLRRQNGGAHLPLSPVSLSGDSFDRSGAQLANTAHAVYVQKNIDLASIKNVNAMKGGQMMRLKGGQMIPAAAAKGRRKQGRKRRKGRSSSSSRSSSP